MSDWLSVLRRVARDRRTWQPAPVQEMSDLDEDPVKVRRLLAEAQAEVIRLSEQNTVLRVANARLRDQAARPHNLSREPDLDWNGSGLPPRVVVLATCDRPREDCLRDRETMHRLLAERRS